MERLQIRGDLPLSRYGGNTRKLLSLWASLSKSKNVVFDAIALDNAGREAVYEAVEAAIADRASAIELSFPDMHGWRRQSLKAEVIRIEEKTK